MRTLPLVLDPIRIDSAEITYLTKYVGKLDSGIAFTDPAYLGALAGSPLSTLVYANRLPAAFPADGLRYTDSLTEYRRHDPILQIVNGTGTYHDLLRAGYFPEHQRSRKVCVIHDEPAAYDFYATPVWNRENVRDTMMYHQDAFVFVSRQALDAWHDYADLGDRPSFHLPNTCAEEALITGEVIGSDRAEVRRRLQYDDEVLNVVVLATVQPRKGQLTAVRALAELRRRRPDLPVCLRLVGRTTQPDYGTQLRKLVADQGLADHVRIVGEVNKRGALNHVFASDVLAVTSGSEAMPMVLLEAMLCGTPIVTTPVGGIPEVLADGEALFVEPGSAEQLAGCIETLADRPERGAGLAEAARRRYWAEFSNTRFTERFAGVLAEFVADRLPRATTAPPTLTFGPGATGRPGEVRRALAARAGDAPTNADLRFAPGTPFAEQLRLGESFVRCGLGLVDADLAGTALAFNAAGGLRGAEYFALSGAAGFNTALAAARLQTGGRSREARELARIKSSLRWRLADRVIGQVADNRVGRAAWRRLKRLRSTPRALPRQTASPVTLRPAVVMVFNSVTQMMFALSLWDDRYAADRADLPLVALVHSNRGRADFADELHAACTATGRFAAVVDITAEYHALYDERITFNRAVRFKSDLLERLAPFTADTVMIAAFMSARAQKLLYEVFTDATIRLFEDGIGSYVPKPIRMTDDGLVDRITGGDCAQAHHIRTIESVDLLLASIPAPPQYFADVERIEFPELTIGGFKVDFAAYAQSVGTHPRPFDADEVLVITQNFSDHLAGFGTDDEVAMNDEVIAALVDGGHRVVIRPHPKASTGFWSTHWRDDPRVTVWDASPATPVELLVDRASPPALLVGISSSCLFYLAELEGLPVRRYPDATVAALRAAATDEYVAMLDIATCMAPLGSTAEPDSAPHADEAVPEPVAPVAPAIKCVTHARYGVDVAVADHIVSPTIQAAIRDGMYERFEADRLARIMDADEVVFELGAGIGFISTMAHRTGRARRIVVVEADPRLIPLIRETHRINGVTDASVYNGLALADLHGRTTETFYVRENFWGSSADADHGMPVVEQHQIPVYSFQALLDEHQPTLLICDIEGGEAGLYRGITMPSVRRILMEVHQPVIGGEAMRQLFLDLGNLGFHYDQRFSQGSVVVFGRA